MTPELLIATTILMGLFVSAGGLWALCYCVGKTRASKPWLWAAVVAYLATAALAVAIAVVTPLDFKWKVLILVSGCAYAFIPPMTLHFLERLHVALETD